MFERKRIRPDAISPTLVAKWGREVLDEGYVPFPKRLLRCLPAIFNGANGIKELQVSLAIADYLRDGLTRGPSVDFLGFLTGLSCDEVKRTLAGMKKKGLIEYTGGDEQLTLWNEVLRDKILKETEPDLGDAKQVDEGEDIAF